ncbi:MAG: ArsI/CadI family heavy metal resistance metalloenzyme [Panacagrimonas sp.]
MNRFHVHVSVKDLEESVRFYSKLFGAQPSVTKPDYAKWMLDDPRINFAISHQKCGGGAIGINHLGIQVDSEQGLTELETRFAEAGLATVEEKAAQCCYAQSDKTWLQDPQGIAWEQFHTLGSVPVFGGNGPELINPGAVCKPADSLSDASSNCAPKAKACCG